MDEFIRFISQTVTVEAHEDMVILRLYEHLESVEAEMRSSGKQKSDPNLVTGSVLKHVLKDTLKAAAQSDGLAKVMLASTPGLRVMLDPGMFAEALVAFGTEGFGKLTFTEMSAFIKE